jgi:hypothetical protein
MVTCITEVGSGAESTEHPLLNGYTRRAPLVEISIKNNSFDNYVHLIYLDELR